MKQNYKTHKHTPFIAAVEAKTRDILSVEFEPLPPPNSQRQILLEVFSTNLFQLGK